MTELKTQKEIMAEFVANTHESRGALLFQQRERQEAIKWIKYLRSDRSNENINKLKGLEWDMANADTGEWKDCLMLFFNITDEDLK